MLTSRRIARRRGRVRRLSGTKWSRAAHLTLRGGGDGAAARSGWTRSAGLDGRRRRRDGSAQAARRARGVRAGRHGGALPDAAAAALHRRRLLDRGRGRQPRVPRRRQGDAAAQDDVLRGHRGAAALPHPDAGDAPARHHGDRGPRRPPHRHGAQEADHPAAGAVEGRRRARRGPRGEGQHRQPRVRDRAGRPQGRRGLQAVVPRARLLRRRDRPRAGRPAAARHHRRHRLDGPPRPSNGPAARTAQTRRASSASCRGQAPDSSCTSASSLAPQSTARTRKSASARAVAGSSRKPESLRPR